MRQERADQIFIKKQSSSTSTQDKNQNYNSYDYEIGSSISGLLPDAYRIIQESKEVS